MEDLKTVLWGAITALFVCGILSSCGKKDSESVSTSEMYFTMALIDPETTTIKCYVRISETHEWGDSIELSENDNLYCNGQKMGRQESFGDYIYYTTRVPLVLNQPIAITFSRGMTQYHSINYVPSPPVVTSPAALNLSFNQELDVNWTPSSNPHEEIDITLSAQIPNGAVMDIVNSRVFQTPESGYAHLESIKSQTSSILNQSVALTLSVSRKTKGTVAKELTGHFDSISQTTVINGTLVP